MKRKGQRGSEREMRRDTEGGWAFAEWESDRCGGTEVRAPMLSLSFSVLRLLAHTGRSRCVAAYFSIYSNVLVATLSLCPRVTMFTKLIKREVATS